MNSAFDAADSVLLTSLVLLLDYICSLLSTELNCVGVQFSTFRFICDTPSGEIDLWRSLSSALDQMRFVFEASG